MSESTNNNGWQCEPEELEAVKSALSAFSRGDNLIAALIAVQQQAGWLPREGMKIVAEQLGVSETTVYSVATFYNRFRFMPPGRTRISVCMGTACHVKRGSVILDSWKRRLGIEEGEVTLDRAFSLDRVDCVGCCAMAPVTVIDDEAKGKMTPATVDGILTHYQMVDEREKRESDAEATATDNGGDND